MIDTIEEIGKRFNFILRGDYVMRIYYANRPQYRNPEVTIQDMINNKKGE